MKFSEHGHTLYVSEALAELDSLGTPDAIAARLRELSIRGGHTAQDCPIHGYLTLRTGRPGHHLWVSQADVAITVGAGPDTIVALPDSVARFVIAHDEHRFIDLCDAGDYTGSTT